MADLKQRLEQHAYAYSLLGEKDLSALLREAAAALRAAPDGFVLVPVKPTEELTLRIAKALQASEQSGWTWEDCSPIEVEGWMELATAAIAAMLAGRPQGVKDA